MGQFKTCFGPGEAYGIISPEEIKGKGEKERKRTRGGEESSGLGVRARRREAMEGAPRASTRRRRLVERGSDRLAFITGQARDLPSDPYPGDDRGAIWFVVFALKSLSRIPDRLPAAFTSDWVKFSCLSQFRYVLENFSFEG